MRLSEFDFYIPKNIILSANGNSFTADNTGKSGARVLISDEFVLKIDTQSSDLKHTYKMLKWLSGKLLVPQIVHYEEENFLSFLLMTKLEGQMACSEKYLEKPKELVKLLTKALKMLWQVPIDGCPYNDFLSQKLETAKYRVKNNLIDLDDVEETTFGENAFKNPKELLDWLYDNKPNVEPVLSHGDFCLPNIFIDDNKISGFIDLGNCALDDKYNDIALCLRSLFHNLSGVYGGKVYPNIDKDLFFNELGITEPDYKKIQYYLLLDELF